jgi:signal peptidase I
MNTQRKNRLLIDAAAAFFAITLLILIYVLVNRVFSLSAYKVENNSMLPTLKVDQIIYAEKVSPDQIKQGDIVICKMRADTEWMQIKRVVGMPGQMLEIKDGIVYIDGKILQEDYATVRAHYDSPPVLIPDKYFYVLGDNRPASADSHQYGPIHKQLIIARVIQP